MVHVQDHVPAGPAARKSVANLAGTEAVRLLLRAGEVPAAWVDGVLRGTVRVDPRLARPFARAVELHAVASAEAFLGNLTAALDDIAEAQLEEAVVMLNNCQVDVEHPALGVDTGHHAIVVIAPAAHMVVVSLQVATYASAPDEVALLWLKGRPAF